MFKVLFYPREVKFYTDSVCGSMTNSMSLLDPIDGLLSTKRRLRNRHEFHTHAVDFTSDCFHMLCFLRKNNNKLWNQLIKIVGFKTYKKTRYLLQ